jgi:hypothetical protein
MTWSTAAVLHTAFECLLWAGKKITLTALWGETQTLSCKAWTRTRLTVTYVCYKAKGCGLDDRGYIPGKANDFLFSTTSRPALGTTQPAIQWVRGASSLGAKRQGREDDLSPTSNADVKNTIPHKSWWRDAYSLSTGKVLPYGGKNSHFTEWNI